MSPALRKRNNGERRAPAANWMRLSVNVARRSIAFADKSSFLPDEPFVPVKQNAAVDGWSRGLAIAAAILTVILLLSFTGAWFALSSGAAQLG